MIQYNPLLCWPSSEELPDSDDIPVDNELQDLIPTLLKAVLALVWQDRWDWFFGIDMGVYYDPENPDAPPLVPDGFLSIGVERVVDEDLRSSYAIWEEGKIPVLMLEVVSKTRNKEYSQKKRDYAKLGVLYYAIYAPLRRRKERLEVYRLVEEQYHLQPGNPVWLPEIGLGIGRELGVFQGVKREWLYWYNEQGQRLATPEECIRQAQQQAEQERQQKELAQQQAEQERQQKERLAAKLRELQIDPDLL